jgi:hypothetical protein
MSIREGSLFHRRMRWSALALTIASIALALCAVRASAATVTIGKVAPLNPPTACLGGSVDFTMPNVISGNSYVLPTSGTLISWSHSAAATLGQNYTFKVFRKIADPTTYQVVAHDGPRLLNPSTINTFPINIPVKAGDVIGFHGAAVNHACTFSDPNSQTYLTNFSDLADGQSAAFNPFTTSNVLNISAVLALKPSDNFSFGTLKRNKAKGSATLAVDVPGPGTLSLSGGGVKPQRAGGGATASKTVGAAGTVKLLVKAKGKKKQKLSDTGKVKVKAVVTYTPKAEIAGDPKTEVKRVKLIKNG